MPIRNPKSILLFCLPYETVHILFTFLLLTFEAVTRNTVDTPTNRTVPPTLRGPRKARAAHPPFQGPPRRRVAPAVNGIHGPLSGHSHDTGPDQERLPGLAHQEDARTYPPRPCPWGTSQPMRAVRAVNRYGNPLLMSDFNSRNAGS